MTKLGDKVLYQRLFRQARPYCAHIAALFLLSLLATPLALLMPLPLKIAVDSGLGSHPLPRMVRALWHASAPVTPASALIFAVALLIVVTILTQLQNLAVSLLQTYTGEKLLLQFRAELFRQIQRLSLSYHDTKGTVDSLYRVQTDAVSIQAITVDYFVPFIKSSLTLAGMFYVTARIDWQLALVALFISPILYVVSKIYRRGLRRGSREAKAYDSSTLAVVQEVLGAIRVVQAFGREDSEQERFVRHSTQGMRARLHLAWVEGRFSLAIGLTSAIGTAVALYVGVRQVQLGALTLGELLLVMGYLAQLYEPLKTLGKKSATLQGHLASVERAFFLLDQTPDLIEKPNARSVLRATGGIICQNVSFAYTSERQALKHVSFEVEPGMRVGIAGATGAGKSTLVNLLLRFYDPTEGRIFLDGVDLRDYKLADLRNQSAIVTQDPVLFSCSIAENIAYARPAASMQEIIAATKAANIHEFIHNLPASYGTQVGERGIRLSGGERQRIALARAFLKDAPILILDEPTSAVDLETEAVIMEAMRNLMQGRTSFLISHRLSPLKDCDTILHIDHGTLIRVTSPKFSIGREETAVAAGATSSGRPADA
jgi:ATP-binding cassette, subfamily B, bacterial